MSHDEVFLQAIIDRPDDDGLRLVYTDWLDEQGAARAEFIRIQCRLAHGGSNDPLRAELRAREQELLTRHGQEWVRRLRPWVRRCVFRRGFPEDLTVPARVFVESGAVLYRLAPVRRVTVELEHEEIPLAVIRSFPESVARENLVLPIGFRGRTLVLAMQDPEDLDTRQKCAFILNREIVPVRADARQIRDAIERYYGQSEVECVDSCCFIEPNFEFDEPACNESVIAKLVALILHEGLACGATEIRIEPAADHFCVWYRINGGLVRRDSPPRRLLKAVAYHICIMAGLDIRQWDQPQAGQFQFNHHERPYELAVAIRPTADGPHIVFTVSVAT